jgi:hypothetical protein
MNATLEFPPIDETMAEQTRSAVVAAPEPAQDLATMDLKTIALSGFYPHSRQAEEAKAALTGLVLDLSNQARIDEAKSLRWRLIGQPMADVRKLTKAMKSTLASASKAIGAEEDRVLAEFGKADALITPHIQAREDEIEAEREAKAQAEAERKAKHQAGIERIQSYVRIAREKRLTSDGIAGGITVLDGMDFGDDWQEYREQAVAARDEARNALQALHAEVKAREEQAAETERLRRLAEQQAAELERLRAAERERQAAEARAESERLEALAIQQREARERAAAASKEYTEGPDAPQVLKEEAETPDATDRATTADASPSGGSMGAGQPAATGPAGGPITTLKLGAISDRLGFTLTRAFVESLGINPVGTEKAAVLFAESDWPRLCDALVAHIQAKRGVVA